jgi:DNA-binding protein H-NS
MAKRPNTEIQIEHMSVEELMLLRERADRLIGEKLVSEKKALQEKLSAIERYEQGTSARTSLSVHRARFRRVPPKYRDPETGATWAGRGQMPRWMAQRVKQGARPEDFLIANRGRQP